MEYGKKMRGTKYSLLKITGFMFNFYAAQLNLATEEESSQATITSKKTIIT